MTTAVSLDSNSMGGGAHTVTKIINGVYLPLPPSSNITEKVLEKNMGKHQHHIHEMEFDGLLHD